jgi:preprotein translocase subunit SecB
MELAPLQLTDYFVTSFRVEAAPGFDPSRETDLDIESLRIEKTCLQVGEEKDHTFSLVMSISQDLVPGKNLPYSYEIQLVGTISAHPDFPKDMLRRAVEVNGPSMLFGSAREILRAATGRGPYGQLLIPSTTFFKPANPPAKKAAKKVTGKKKP